VVLYLFFKEGAFCGIPPSRKVRSVTEVGTLSGRHSAIAYLCPKAVDKFLRTSVRGQDINARQILAGQEAKWFSSKHRGLHSILIRTEAAYRDFRSSHLRQYTEAEYEVEDYVDYIPND
jgi:hypothetical protein